MKTSTRGYAWRVLPALGWLILISGCELATNPLLPADPSAASADLAAFIQQFAREAIAAFLF